jgi:hypothetical protein
MTLRCQRRPLCLLHHLLPTVPFCHKRSMHVIIILVGSVLVTVHYSLASNAASASHSPRVSRTTSRVCIVPANSFNLMQWSSPSSTGSWVVTQAVIHSCVLPVRYSPYISVMHAVSKPPPRMASTSLEPVVILTTDFWRLCERLRALVHPLTGQI